MDESKRRSKENKNCSLLSRENSLVGIEKNLTETRNTINKTKNGNLFSTIRKVYQNQKWVYFTSFSVIISFIFFFCYLKNCVFYYSLHFRRIICVYFFCYFHWICGQVSIKINCQLLYFHNTYIQLSKCMVDIYHNMGNTIHTFKQNKERKKGICLLLLLNFSKIRICNLK